MVWKLLACLTWLCALNPAEALRPRDYSDELHAANLSHSLLATRELQHCEVCYKALLALVLASQDWKDLLDIKTAWEDDNGWLKEGLEEEAIGDNYPGGVAEKDVALVVAIQAIFNEVAYYDGVLKQAAQDKVWDDKLVRETAMAVYGSKPVYDFAHEMMVSDSATLAGGGAGSIVLASWVLALLEPYFKEILTAHTGKLYNMYVKRGRESFGVVDPKVGEEADKLEADFQKLVNAGGKIGALLSKVENDYTPYGMDGTDGDKDECLYDICQGVEVAAGGMFPGAAELKKGDKFTGFVALLTAAKADRTSPVDIEIPGYDPDPSAPAPEGGKPTFYFRPSLSACVQWITDEWVG